MPLFDLVEQMLRAKPDTRATEQARTTWRKLGPLTLATFAQDPHSTPLQFSEDMHDYREWDTSAYHMQGMVRKGTTVRVNFVLRHD